MGTIRGIAVNDILDLLLNQSGNIYGFHILISFVGNRRQKVELNGNGLGSLLVENFEAVDKCNWHDGALCFHGGTETATME